MCEATGTSQVIGYIYYIYLYLLSIYCTSIYLQYVASGETEKKELCVYFHVFYMHSFAVDVGMGATDKILSPLFSRGVEQGGLSCFAARSHAPPARTSGGGHRWRLARATAGVVGGGEKMVRLGLIALQCGTRIADDRGARVYQHLGQSSHNFDRFRAVEENAFPERNGSGHSCSGRRMAVSTR